MQKRSRTARPKLKQQQNLYEAARRTATVQQEPRRVAGRDSEMKRKFKIMNHQIEQLKEEISAKDIALVKEHFDHMKVEKEKESCGSSSRKRCSKTAEERQQLATREMQKLEHVISEADRARAA